MPKIAQITVRIEPAMRKRIECLAHALGRSKSYVIENALASYLDENEWQVTAIREGVAEADSAEAEWVDHEEVKKRWTSRANADSLAKKS